MDQDLLGTWVITQTWNGDQPYSFNANFLANGTIIVTQGEAEFFGTYQVLYGTNQIALAIANFNGFDGFPQSITAYTGNVWGQYMGGLAQGAATEGETDSTTQGTWSAARPLLEVNPKK